MEEDAERRAFLVLNSGVEGTEWMWRVGRFWFYKCGVGGTEMDAESRALLALDSGV
jgi:hypothetical protein